MAATRNQDNRGDIVLTGNLHGKLGLARRAGLLVSGHDAVKQCVSSGKVCLIIMAADAATRTRREFATLAENMGIPWVQVGTKQELGNAIGTEDRSVIAITDKGFADSIHREIVI